MNGKGERWGVKVNGKGEVSVINWGIKSYIHINILYHIHLLYSLITCI